MMIRHLISKECQNSHIFIFSAFINLIIHHNCKQNNKAVQKNQSFSYKFNYAKSMITPP